MVPRDILFRFYAAVICLIWFGQAPVSANEHNRQLAGLESFDEAIVGLLDKWNIPGASLAVAKDGRLLLAKGYGMANKQQGISVTPSTVFRVGSITKTLAAVVTLKLVDDGSLQLDDRILPILQRNHIVGARIKDERSASITVRHLLQHSAGFDRKASGDPFFQPRLQRIAQKYSEKSPSCATIVKDAFSQRLDFAPGERFAYSNLGYCILGKVAERLLAVSCG